MLPFRHLTLEKADGFCLFLLISILLLLGYPTLFWALGGDHSLEMFLGKSLLAGELPYRDFYDIDFPLSFFLHAGIGAVFGQDGVGLRSFDLLLCGADSLLIFIFLRLLGFSAFAGTSGAVLFLLSYYSLGSWHTAQRDGFAIPLLLVSTLLCLQETRQGKPSFRMVAAGILAAVAFWLKPIFATHALMLSAMIFLLFPPERKLKAFAEGLAGFLLFSLLPLAYLGYHGLWDEFLDAAVRFNREIFVTTTFNAENLKAYYVPRDSFTALCLLLLLAGFGALSKASRESWVPLVLLFLSTQLDFLLQGKGECSYQQTPFLAVVGMFGGIALAFLWESSGKLPLRVLGAFLLLAALGSGWLGYLKAVGSQEIYRDLLTGTISPQDYTDSMYPLGKFQRRMGETIGNLTREDQRVLIWAWEGQILLSSGRLSASPLYSSQLYAIMPERHSLRAKWRKRLLEDLKSPRTAVLYCRKDDENWTQVIYFNSPSSCDILFNDSEIAEIIRKDFVPALQNEKIALYLHL